MLSHTSRAVTALILAVSCHAARADVDFSRDVRPILSNVCFHCHGPDDESREAELRLDLKPDLFSDRGGYAAVVPHDVEQSELIRRILSDDPDEQMPPPDSNKTLTAQQRDILVQWVQSGAEWEQHWAFNPPQQRPVPEVAGPRADWPKNEIDHFVLQRMKSAGLNPAVEADPYTIVRRVFLDAIGLPPSPEEADQWVERIWGSAALQHASAQADSVNRGSLPQADDEQFAAMVDSLLARPEYGERWARHWLDLARYADTNGYEKDRPRSIWPWRDWVINALNEDMPFDQFTIEQLAGDLLPNATRSQLVATGFHRNTMLNEEGGIDPLEFRFHAMTDRVATTGTTWLGMTVGCAQCHTHKYDPLSHREYYGLMAFLNNCDEPTLELPSAEDQSRWAANRERAAKLLADLPQQWPVEAFQETPSSVQGVSGTQQESFRVADDGVITVSGAAASAVYTVELQVAAADVNELRLETMARDGRPGPGHTAHGNFVLSELSLTVLHGADERQPIEVPLQPRSASASQDGFPVRNAVDGDSGTGWAIAAKSGVPRTASASFAFDLPKSLRNQTKPLQLRVRLSQEHGAKHTIERFRIAVGRSLPEDELAKYRDESLQNAFSEWWQQQHASAVSWEPLRPVRTDANLALLTIEPDDIVFASGDTAKQDFYEVEYAPLPHPVTSLQLEVLPDERLPARGPGTTYYEGTIGDFFLTEFQVRGGGKLCSVNSASESYAANRFGKNPVAAALTVDGDIQTGWSVHNGQGQRHTAVFNLAEPIPAGTPVTIRMTFGRHYASSLGKFRLLAADADVEQVADRLSRSSRELLLLDRDDLTAAEKQQLLNEFLLTHPLMQQQAEEIRRLRSAPAVPTTLVLRERDPRNPRPTFRHHRGEYLQPKEPVEPVTPAILHEWPDQLPHDRLGFAKWLVSPDNPLTARVVVNRHWARFFGNGIVDTLDDFGLQGSSPSHPDLLDWLAVTFVEDDNWSLKSLHRRILNSATYRQSAVVSSRARDIDPQNRFLSHAPRFRLDAEIVRDAALKATNLLSAEMYGPPVRPPQPAGITEVAFGNPKWNVSPGEDRFRRSIYTEIKRTAPFAMITTFDGLSGETCTAQRNRSNSPLQALTLLNDVMFVELARECGLQVARQASSHERDDAAIATQLFRQVLTRFPQPEELQRLLDFVHRTRISYGDDPAAVQSFLAEHDAEGADQLDPDIAVEAVVWANLVRVLLGLDEAVTRP